MKIQKRALLKSQLAAKLYMSPKTLSRFIKPRETKIREIYPAYTTKSKLLYPKVIDYIIEEYGYHPDEIYAR